MSAANRGKYAEDKVKAHLKKLDESTTNFDFERVLDAHAAGGRFQARTGDFTWYTTGDHGTLEVKEVESNTYRLPYKNVSTESVAKLRKRTMAGGSISILVCFMPKKEWVVVPLQFLRERDPKTPSGSWDLSVFSKHAKLDGAMHAIGLGLSD